MLASTPISSLSSARLGAAQGRRPEQRGATSRARYSALLPAVEARVSGPPLYHYRVCWYCKRGDTRLEDPWVPHTICVIRVLHCLRGGRFAGPDMEGMITAFEFGHSASGSAKTASGAS
jgi:hypothetical protein